MPTIYDSNLTYDSPESYDFILEYARTRKDLYLSRDADNTFVMSALDKNSLPLDLTGYTIEGRILEYWSTNKIFPATYTITDAANGKYTISVDNSVNMIKPRYVYEVFATAGLQKLKIHHGQLLVE